MSSAIVPPATGVSTESTKPKLYAHLYRGGRNDCGSTCSTLPKQKGLGHISCFFSRSDSSPCTSSQHHVVICVHTAYYALPLRHTCTQTRREETMIQRGPNQIKYKQETLTSPNYSPRLLRGTAAVEGRGRAEDERCITAKRRVAAVCTRTCHLAVILMVLETWKHFGRSRTEQHTHAPNQQTLIGKTWEG